MRNSPVFSKLYLSLLFRPPTPRFGDKLIFFYCLVLTVLLVLPISLLRRKSIKDSLSLIFPRLMPKDLLIEFHQCKFVARKGKRDIMLLNPFSEPWMRDYFNPQKGDVVIDVGAHVGKYSLPAAKAVGEEGKVIAIEADPDNFQALLNNIKLNGFNNVVTLNVAAFNQDGRYLWLTGSRDDDRRLTTEESGVRVETKTIDGILKGSLGQGLDRVKWVKIDVEGAEGEVLEGMKGIIENAAELRLLIEVHRGNMGKVQTILKGFKRRILGGDDPNIPVLFYWKNQEIPETKK